MIQQNAGWHVRLTAVILLITQVITGCAQSTANTKNVNKGTDNMKTESNYTVNKTEQEWKEQLTPEQYYILRQKGTERPFTGKLLMNKEKGVYKCAACGNELFTDDMKFDSHCGWPSFDKEIAGGKIIKHEDNTLGMHRTEILCGKCGSHLGHIFDDGPTETGMRYCVNSVSLEFAPAGAAPQQPAATVNNNIDTVTLGGGCFWCVEAVYEQLDGVIKVESGYSGGHMPNPSYKAVCTGTTGHAEVVQVTYDKSKTSLDEVLKVFFTVHDPTTLNRQGADVGTQYRSVIYYRNAEQEQKASEIIAELNKAHIWDSPIVTEVTAFDKFYKAEDYHQNYYEQNPDQGYCRMVIRPKVEKFEKLFKDRLKKTNQQ